MAPGQVHNPEHYTNQKNAVLGMTRSLLHTAACHRVRIVFGSKKDSPPNSTHCYYTAAEIVQQHRYLLLRPSTTLSIDPTILLARKQDDEISLL
jgi:hypothetical protein